jgi:hypothetical protein
MLDELREKRKPRIRLKELNRGHNLRNQETDLALPKPKTIFLKRSFKYSASMLWNNLPLDAKRATSLSQFKRIALRSCPFRTALT